uniref:FAM186A/B C-terminal domain-containing protein n=1 Tax=Pyxicephalus adspersus TaxID=30357 RepID=A0AAV3BA11_PYXAD|nr:TPA: hypothetical protein GDO54_000312 [Pyxicephalus adspersus]
MAKKRKKWMGGVLMIVNECGLLLSCPRLLQKMKERNKERFHYSSPDRFITWQSFPPAASNVMSEQGQNFFSSRKNVNGLTETFLKTDMYDKSFHLGKKQALPSLWPQLGVFPEIPRLLELDVSLPRIRALRCMQTR